MYSIFQTLEFIFQTMEFIFQSLENSFHGLENSFPVGVKYFSCGLRQFFFPVQVFLRALFLVNFGVDRQCLHTKKIYPAKEMSSAGYIISVFYKFRISELL